MKKLLITLLKFGISFSILGYLFYRAGEDQSFAALVHQEKQWGLLVLAFAVAMGAVSVTFTRWFLLVWALGLPFTLKDAFRLGFLGFLCSFLTLGVVGGDAIKAVFIARQIPRRRAEVVATVVLDRAIGLFALFIVASLALLAVDLTAIQARNPSGLIAVQRTGQVAFGLTIAGVVAAALFLLPGVTTSRPFEALVRIPRIGGTLKRLIGALRVYRRKLWLLAVALAMSLAVHTLLTVTIFLIACGLPGAQPTLGTHLVIVPISMLGSSVPLPGGLGAFEFALDFLYRGVSSTAMPEGQGFVIALAYRVITLVIAMIGVFYYLTSRREVAQLIKEAEQEREQPGEAFEPLRADGQECVLAPSPRGRG